MHIVRASEELTFSKISRFVALLLPRRINFYDLFFFLLIVFFPTQLGKHFWPNFSFISGLRIDYLSPTLYVSDIFIIIFIFYSSFLFGKKVFPPKQIIFVYLFLAIGIFLSKNPLSGWYQLVKFTEYLLLGYSLKNYFSFPDKRHQFILPLSIAILFESLLGIWQYMLQSSIGGIFYFFGERTFTPQTPGIANVSLGGQLVLRPYATFSHPNVFAGFLVIGMIVLISLWNNLQTKRKKIFFLVTLAIGSTALFITFSRTAMFLWIIFLLYLFFKKFSFSKIFILIGGVLLVGMLLSFPFLRLRFLSLTISSESVVDRVILMQAAWRMILNHPVFGVGFANFLGELSAYSPRLASVLLIQPVHNIFFLIAAETGIVGLFLTVWVLSITVIQLLILNKNTNRKEKLASFCLVFVFLGVLFLGQFDHYFLTLQQGQIVTTVVLALCWGHIISKKAKRATIEK